MADRAIRVLLVEDNDDDAEIINLAFNHASTVDVTVEAGRFIETISDGAGRMSHLIRDVLEYSRVGTEGSQFQPTSCDEILKQVKEDLEAAIGESDAVIEYETLPTIGADRSQLMRLFRNLIGNAIKYRSDEPPHIRVTAKKITVDTPISDGPKTRWQFKIQDNGIGMDMEASQHIFAVFQRLHTRSEYPGTGIGLAICRRIVERHGGEIWAESERGKGSTFIFTITDMQG